MVREDILEGLKIAVAKGETLQQAMQSFFNAGYKKEEIEESARAFQMFQAGQPIPPPTPPQTSSTTKPGLKQKIKQKASGYKQQVQEKSKGKKLVIILLAIVLFVLLATLVAVLIFKEQIVGLFGG